MKGVFFMKMSFDYHYLLKNKQKVTRVAIIAVLIVATLFLFLFRTGNQNEKEMMKKNNPDSQSTLQNEASIDVIVVDVAGEVKTPSVIELPVESRINDAIKATGGLTKDADISQINRAAVLSDGEKVFIPTKAASTTGGSKNSNGAGNQGSVVGKGSAGETKININSATTTELQEVPGIGPVTADKIIRYRTDNGLFRKLEDLKKVSGIGDKTFAKMKPYICI